MRPHLARHGRMKEFLSDDQFAGEGMTTGNEVAVMINVWFIARGCRWVQRWGLLTCR